MLVSVGENEWTTFDGGPILLCSWYSSQLVRRIGTINSIPIYPKGTMKPLELWTYPFSVCFPSFSGISTPHFDGNGYPTRFQLQPPQAQGLKKSLTKWDQREHRFLWLLKQAHLFLSQQLTWLFGTISRPFLRGETPVIETAVCVKRPVFDRGRSDMTVFRDCQKLILMSHSCISYDMYISIIYIIYEKNMSAILQPFIEQAVGRTLCKQINLLRGT